MDCSPPSSCVHRILQARILEWVAISSSRGSSQARDQTYISWLAGRFFTAELPEKPTLWPTFWNAEIWSRPPINVQTFKAWKPRALPLSSPTRTSWDHLLDKFPPPKTLSQGLLWRERELIGRLQEVYKLLSHVRQAVLNVERFCPWMKHLLRSRDCFWLSQCRVGATTAI